ncbi:glycosyltransferase family 4 protein [Polluticoccus soli]|uniref:glycosyltransferase family 4 protein n=1 Tax=Polluticoccus soli TaxID=3034150 RepID=UPI0023E2B37A|nr:glycosyltransferase family 1 protein [Flavipsychrobacter sp. JY13-12]
MIDVTYIYREFRETAFSIEGIFDVVRKKLSGTVNDRSFHFDATKSRVRNVLDIRKLPAGINHVTGDIYFLTIGLRKSKNVVTIHDLGHYEHLKQFPLKFIVYHLFWMYLPLRKADVITVVSETTKAHLLKAFGFAKDKVRVVYNPVKPIFKYSKKETLNTKLRILQVGSGWQKNLNNLIEAVKGTNYHLDIVGLPDAESIEKMQRFDILHTISSGLTDVQLYQKYLDCDILFFASIQEGFGMPIIEAQAVGRPVITSNVGAMLEVAQDTAVLVEPRNVAQIRQAIDALAQDKNYYDLIVEKGLGNASKYSIEHIADEYLNIYKELAS